MRKEKKEKAGLKDHRGEIARCVRCGACSTVCPSFLADRRESRSPRGRIALIGAVADGLLPASRVYRDRLAACAGCLACEARCASGVPVLSIIIAAKEQAVREAGPGLLASVIGLSLKEPLVMRSLAWLAPMALHYQGADVRGTGSKKGRATSDKRRETRRGERIIFFPGCAVRYFQQDIGEAAAAVLEHLGYEVIVPEGLQCCGRPFLSLGDREAAAAIARENAALLRSLRADAIVTACASCGMTFKRDYAGLLSAVDGEPPRVLDIHELLAERLDRLEAGRLPGRVTVHDPCHLGRGQGLSGALRRVLRAVPGLDLAEMREPQQCCGFGGMMRATHPGQSIAIGRRKAKDIVATGAPLVVTGCPGCRMQISDALRREGSDAEVVHTVQVLAEAIGARSQEPEFRRRAVLLDSGS